MPILTTLAASWAAATHMELDGVCATASVLQDWDGEGGAGHGAEPLFLLCDTDTRTAVFRDQPVRLQADGTARVTP